VLELIVDAFVTAFIAVTVYGHILLLRALLVNVRARHSGTRCDMVGRRPFRLTNVHQI
jgi:hypothetical protein